jgi:pimeloyl-ACP methyl ester carboxylesterase
VSEPIRRRFADLPHGQVHFREAGRGRGNPVLLIHGSPGSARQLERLITALAARHHVIAPDTPGNGDSAALSAPPDITDLAAVAQTFVQVIGLPPAHVYGTHTGAAIATELALRAPASVRTLALEGLGLFEGETLAEHQAHYTPSFAPDLDGTHLLRAFQFCRDQFLFYPWYRRTATASRSNGLPPAEDLHAMVLEVLKAGTSYAANYQAAFRWDARPRLPQVACPLMLMASQADPLHDGTQGMAGDTYRFFSLPRYGAPDFAAVRLAALESLFDEA